jgi:hypothetical protein
MSKQPGEDGDEQRDLEGEVRRVGVDVDLLTDGWGLVGEVFVSDKRVSLANRSSPVSHVLSGTCLLKSAAVRAGQDGVSTSHALAAGRSRTANARAPPGIRNDNARSAGLIHDSSVTTATRSKSLA